MATAFTDDDDFYKMDASPKGICLIINNFEFELSESLDTGPAEKENLTRIFDELDFEVRYFENLTCEQMKRQMENIKNTNHSNFNCFVCCISSHGRKTGVCGTDEYTVTITELQSHVYSRECPSLAGKPKVFFVDTCRGGEGHRGLYQPRQPAPARRQLVADKRDFLLSFATTPDNVSWSETSKGSIFFHYLTNLLESNAKSASNGNRITTEKSSEENCSEDKTLCKVMKRTISITSSLVDEIESGSGSDLRISEGDLVTVVVSHLSLEEDSPAMNNPSINKLFVEYTFLGLPPEDTETPFALPKPGPCRAISFNFSKTIHVDMKKNYQRRQMLASHLLPDDSEQGRIRFTVVSEPDDPEKDCEDVGAAYVSVRDILKKDKDIIDEYIDILDPSDEKTVVGQLNVTLECLAALKAVAEEMQVDGT